MLRLRPSCLGGGRHGLRWLAFLVVAALAACYQRSQPTGADTCRDDACPAINECTDGSHTCHTNARCADTAANYTCTCNDGYRGDGHTCTPIDECAEDTHTCHDHATCADTDDGYTCTCKAGYRGDGYACTAIDECAEGTHTCHEDATCDDITPGYTCTCKPGYGGDGRTCAPIDECAEGTHTCHENATCDDITPGYTCACNLGFTGDGHGCARAAFRSLAVGGLHSCGIREDGSLWCWGSNTVGQLGLGDETDRSAPAVVGFRQDWRNVTAGLQHTCATRTDNSLWCWGYDGGFFPFHLSTINSTVPEPIGTDSDWLAVDASDHKCATQTDNTLWCWNLNNVGQLGDASTTNREVPTPEVSKAQWRTVATGRYHTCAIQPDNSLWCWGSNSSGQIAFSTIGYTRRRPTQVGADDDWLSISAGDKHTCGLRSGGGLWCWGHNQTGELGDPTLGAYTRHPTAIRPDLEWTMVDAGLWGHTCGVTRIDEDNRGLWCWGRNAHGQLGNGSLQPLDAPSRVGTASDWLHVGANGNRHTCALRGDGRVWCWGARDLGQLGDGISAAKLVPARSGDDNDWLDMVAGDSHMCAVRADHTLWCWGKNRSGQLGDGSTTSRQLPVKIGDSSDWDTLAAGGENACARRLDNGLWCWGANSHGQLGDGTDAEHTAPNAVEGEWLQVAVGEAHVCAIATTGRLWCWGRGGDGQLGNGTLGSDVDLPVLIGTSQWRALAAGSRHTCGIDTLGELWCWGANEEGQVGDSSGQRQHAEPFAVDAATTDWNAVVAGSAHTCAIRDNGTLWCWGSNTSGQLGIGDDSGDQRSTPAQVPGSAWANVALTSWSTCATKENGELWCWGPNGSGQLGNGTTDGTSSPTRIGDDGSPWSVIANGPHDTCAIREDHSLWCWGRNRDGQHGDGIAWSTEPVMVNH